MRSGYGWRAGLGLLLGACGARAAEPGSIHLALAPDRALVREIHTLRLTNRVHSWELEVPAEADLATLSVRSERGDVNLLQWERTPASPVRPAAPRLRPAAGGFALAPARGPAPATTVRCLLASEQPRQQQVEVAYQLRGLGWRAHYEILIRGDIANYLEPLSLDLLGRVVVSNGTARAFRGAEVTLVGEVAPPARATPPAADLGFLWLDDDSPLADLWRPDGPQVRAGVPYAYRLPGPVDLPAHGETSVRLVSAQRKPAERLYTMDADTFPLNAPGAWRPLTRVMTFRNDPAAGLGAPLPAGDALIYLGSQRGALYQEARLSHTPSRGEIRINLGPAPGVTALRRTLPRARSGAGFTEETVEVRVANVLPSAVNVEVRERPPVPLAWDVVRSSRPYEAGEGHLHYVFQVAGRSESELTYVVRVTEPGW